VATLAVRGELPARLQLQATLRAAGPGRPLAVFDYRSPTSFKYVLLDPHSDRLVIGHRDARGFHTDAFRPRAFAANTDYRVTLQLTGRTARAVVGGVVAQFTFAQPFQGALGFGAQGGPGFFDDVAARAL
jgi:hypothetical protein